MGTHINVVKKQILEETGLLRESGEGVRISRAVPLGLLRRSCCRHAYLRGAFLATGTLSDPGKGYHLEISSSSEDYAKSLNNFMNKLDLAAKMVLRRERYVVYLKESETIVELLNRMGAHKALLAFENIRITKEVVEYAHDHGVVVEAELGTLAGVEDDVHVEAEDSSYTRPEDVEEFVTRTGCDSLAIAIGTSHGAYKFKPGTKPQLRFDILEEVAQRLPGFPIVLHGASSVPQEFVRIINEHGGKMPDAIGIPEEMLRQAATMAVCKINIDSDLRLAMTASIRKYFDEHPEGFDPRAYLKPARTAIHDMVRHKIVDVLGCNGKA